MDMRGEDTEKLQNSEKTTIQSQNAMTQPPGNLWLQ